MYVYCGRGAARLGRPSLPRSPGRRRLARGGDAPCAARGMALPMGLATAVAGFFGVTVAVELFDRKRAAKPQPEQSGAPPPARGTPADGAVAYVELFDTVLGDIFDDEMNPDGMISLAVRENTGLLQQHNSVLAHLTRLEIEFRPAGLSTCINLRPYLEVDTWHAEAKLQRKIFDECKTLLAPAGRDEPGWFRFWWENASIEAVDEFFARFEDKCIRD
jgi:hypothetical protein